MTQKDGLVRLQRQRNDLETAQYLVTLSNRSQKHRFALQTDVLKWSQRCHFLSVTVINTQLNHDYVCFFCAGSELFFTNS